MIYRSDEKFTMIKSQFSIKFQLINYQLGNWGIENSMKIVNRKLEII